MGRSTCRTCHYGHLELAYLGLHHAPGRHYREVLGGKDQAENLTITRQIFTESSISSNMKASYVEIKNLQLGHPLGEAIVLMTSLEERCGQGGSLAATARCDNRQRQHEGSVEP